MADAEEQMTMVRDKEFELKQEEFRLQRVQDELTAKKKALDLQEFELSNASPVPSVDSSTQIAELAERSVCRLKSRAHEDQVLCTCTLYTCMCNVRTCMYV